MTGGLTWLHISDLHIRSGESYDRDVVLRALVKQVDERRAGGAGPDVILVTGDIAHSGKPGEYEEASRFFDSLLAAADLPKQRLFVVPGNHDVDRTLGVGLARTLTEREEADNYFDPACPKPHLSQKLGAYCAWFTDYFAGVRITPPDTTCGPAERVTIKGLTLAILPLNSALFCQDDHDHAKLLIGRRSLDVALASQLADSDANLTVALIHHPLEWLSEVERSNIKAVLRRRVDLVLTGHLHEPEVQSVVAVSGETLDLVAGAAYQTRKWPNSAFYVHFDGRQVCVEPIRYEDRPEEIWTTDPSVFPNEPEFRRCYPVGDPAAGPPPPPDAKGPPGFHTNIPARGDLPFVGRDEDLGRLREHLAGAQQGRVVLVHGPSGVGKSELAREYGRRHHEDYPGGALFINFSDGGQDLELARLGRNLLQLDVNSDLPLRDQAEQTLARLAGLPQLLLIYDNPASQDEVDRFLPPAGTRWHVIVTSIDGFLVPGWPKVGLDPLSPAVALELVRKVAGTEVADGVGSQLVEAASGLPIQLVPASRTMAYEQRHGRLENARTELAAETRQSFGLVYDRLDDDMRLLLHATCAHTPQRIPRPELLNTLAVAAGAATPTMEGALDACLDLRLLEGRDDLRMHQLLAEFLAGIEIEQSGEQDLSGRLDRTREQQARRLLELAALVKQNPGDSDPAATLLSFRKDPAYWVATGHPIGPEVGKSVGEALIEIGRFTDARPWFERAVEAQGDVNGRVDHESLGDSLHQVGFCKSADGDFAGGRPWFERAVETKQKGDVNGRVDHESLGDSLHLIGWCMSETGDSAGARLWYEQAVEAKQKGDVHGRVDQQSVGTSLNQVGWCMSETGDSAGARLWYEQAVEAKQKGDVNGRVDHESLGTSLHEVGWCMSKTGDSAGARPWYERAVEAKQKGDVHGRVDHQSLGTSLHQVGWCMSQTGDYAVARPWFERAVEAREKGDIHGRVDHRSLGGSLHQVGWCMSQTGDYSGSRPWYERAVEAKQKGDVHGRVDHQSLGVSLLLIGWCISQTADSAVAWPWYERAVEAAQKGDVHGRVDHQSLGGSLHLIGWCMSENGDSAGARPWYERAVEAKQKGDIHGRVDYESLGGSLHQVGWCMSENGDYAGARPWYERAVEAKQKGDIHGRVDHQSLGRSRSALEWARRNGN